MQLKMKTRLSFLYFKKHLRRYLFLVIALSFGFSVITVMTSLSAGMTGALHEAALRHYGGELVILGYNFDRAKRMHIPDPAAVEEAIAAAGLSLAGQYRRINLFRDGFLYFGSNSVRQKNTLGIDWESESGLIDHMNLVAGSLEELKRPGSILISEAVARQLGCRLGDDLTLKVDTLTGQKNTGTFVVRGIFRDTSIFGYYKCFIALDEMRDLLCYKEGEVSLYGLVPDHRGATGEEIASLYAALADRLPMGDPITMKEELTWQLDHRGWTGVRYFLVPLAVYVSQVDELLAAMDLLAYFLYTVISLIILVSISVTYRVILRERTKEIATIRALGLQKRDVIGILLLESLWLFLLSLLVGAVLSALLLKVLTISSYSGIPGFELFLRGGRLVPSFSLKTVAGNIALLLIITLPAVLVPSLRVSRLDLTRALAGNT